MLCVFFSFWVDENVNRFFTNEDLELQFLDRKRRKGVWHILNTFQIRVMFNDLKTVLNVSHLYLWLYS